MWEKNGRLARRFCEHAQVTCGWGVEKRIHRINCCLTLYASQVEHLCLGDRSVMDSEVPSWTCLRFLPCHGKSQITGVNYTCTNPWNTGANSIVWHGPSCAVLASLLMFFCLGNLLVNKVTSTNLFLAFHLWFYDCSCILPMRAHTSSKLKKKSYLDSWRNILSKNLSEE